MVKLGEILQPQPKSKIKAGDGLNKGQYKFFTSSNIQIKFIDNYTYNKSALIFGTGGNASIHYCDELFATSTDCLVFYGKENVNIKSVYQYINGNIHLLEAGFKGAGLKHISKEYILNIEINLPPFARQHHIAATLDKANELIALRKKQLQELDTLAESVFYDMFGDPVKNEEGWECEPVISHTSCIVPGRDKPKSFTGDIPWVTTAELNHLGYTFQSSIGLNEDEVNEVRAKIIPKGSVIITCVGDLGVVSIAGNRMVINQQLHAFQCLDNLNNIFLAYCLSYRKDYMYKMASNTTVPYMNKSICNSIPILLPPLSLQTRFASIIEKIEEQKAQVRKALQESEDLFQRLMQDLFKPD